MSLRKKIKSKNIRHAGKAAVYWLAFMVLFWGLYDGVITYLTPLIIQEGGYSNSTIGLIIGSSSVAGAILDFFICRVFARHSFRRIFLVMLSVCAFYPILLWGANTIWWFILAMILWGLYYDLYTFGSLDFVSRFTRQEDYPQNFGILSAFYAASGILAPLVSGLFLIEQFEGRSIGVSLALLAVSFIFFLALIYSTRRVNPGDGAERMHRRRGLLLGLGLWRRLGRKIWPFLSVTFFLYTVEAFFWTIAPLYADELGTGPRSGMFLSAFMIPPLILGWFIGRLSRRFGKIALSFFTLFMGSVSLLLFFLDGSFWFVTSLAFISSFFFSLSFPAINSLYSILIEKKVTLEKEIEGLEDFAINLGFVVGPIAAGFASELLGVRISFGFLGLVGSIVAIFLGWVAIKRKKKLLSI